MQFTYEVNGQLVTCRLDKQPDGGYRLRVGERERICTVTPLGAGRWLLNLDGQQFEVHGVAAGSARYVQVAGQAYTLTASSASARRQRQPGSVGSDLTAQMPGQIREVRVQVGDAVEAGATLVVLEAMKMELRVTAPAAGQIRHVYVQVGDLVERGQRLVEIGA